MAKTAKNTRGNPPPILKRRQPRSCVWWFLGGIALGLVAANVMSTRRPATATPDEQTATSQRESRPAPVQPKFQFPQLLNDATVDLSDKAPPPPPPARHPSAVTESPPATPLPAVFPKEVPDSMPLAPSGSYVVQAGSFTNATDAERRKAELAMLGVTANVQTATLPNGRTAYRVRTAAYPSKKAAEQARDLLKSHGKDAVAYPDR